ncbi:MAG: alpha/beta hydrolase-fold protein [Ferruginibacter sp.]|nr:alpha/beta hydrolase-fold protein [Ferruginibacter sp.]
MKNMFLIACLCSLGFAARSQELTQYEKQTFVTSTDSMPYRLLLPKDFNPKKKYPLVFVLHGAGERGRDNQKQLVHGGKLFLKEEIRNEFPAIVVFPQCPQDSYWSNVSITTDKDNKRTFNFRPDGEPTKAMTLAQGLLEQLIKTYRVKKKQVYIAGLSMGGMGTFEMVRRNPKLFAAAVPICGGADPATASKLVKTDWWIFHGAKDNVVPVDFSIKMDSALSKEKASVKLTIYPEAMHDSWTNTFAEPGLLPWLFAQRK